MVTRQFNCYLFIIYFVRGILTDGICQNTEVYDQPKGSRSDKYCICSDVHILKLNSKSCVFSIQPSQILNSNLCEVLIKVLLMRACLITLVLILRACTSEIGLRSDTQAEGCRAGWERYNISIQHGQSSCSSASAARAQSPLHDQNTQALSTMSLVNVLSTGP